MTEVTVPLKNDAVDANEDETADEAVAVNEPYTVTLPESIADDVTIRLSILAVLV